MQKVRRNGDFPENTLGNCEPPLEKLLFFRLERKQEIFLLFEQIFRFQVMHVSMQVFLRKQSRIQHCFYMVGFEKFNITWSVWTGSAAGKNEKK